MSELDDPIPRRSPDWVAYIRETSPAAVKIIEAEARSALRAEIAEAVKGLEPRDFEPGHEPNGWYYDGFEEARESVLSVITQGEG